MQPTHSPIAIPYKHTTIPEQLRGKGVKDEREFSLFYNVFPINILFAISSSHRTPLHECPVVQSQDTNKAKIWSITKYKLLKERIFATFHHNNLLREVDRFQNASLNGIKLKRRILNACALENIKKEKTFSLRL